MEFWRHLKEGGRGYILVALLIIGAILLLVAAKSEGGEKTADDRVPTHAAKEALENELEELIRAMKSIDRVKVVLTLESGSEYVWENGKNTLVIAGRVRGVAVVCTGGNDPVVKKQVMEMLCALLDLPMQAVSVSE